MNNFNPFLTLMIIPLITFTFLINNDASAQEIDLECPENKVIVVRTTNPNPICVSDSTAQRWVVLEMAEIIVQSEETKITPEISEIDTLSDEIIPKIPHSLIPDDFSRVQNYLVTISGGELTEPIIFQTFSKFEPGDKENYIASFQDLGFNTYFSLESNPSMDKIEFYNLVAKTINAGKDPELFDVSIDFLAGDNSVVITVNYPKCEITDYTPYSQELILFYQYSNAQREEIRDATILYCSGLNAQVYDKENQKIIPIESLPYIPSEDNSVQGYVVHFSGTDFDGLYTVETFSNFSPSLNVIETSYDVLTSPGNPLDSKPQFFLESLPSKDKEELYRYFAKWVNPGQPPFFVDVSVDLITGDGKILQRWNYNDCSFYDYTTYLEDNLLKFTYTGEQSSEIRDKSEFTCNGMNLEIAGDKPLTNSPLKSFNSIEDETSFHPKIPEHTQRAQSFVLAAFDGEFDETYTSDRFQKFEPIRKDRGPLTPLSHAKQYDFGFVIESLPQKGISEFYEHMSRYVNAGKDPEPFDVNVDTINGDGTILHRLQYTNCDGVDFWWYLQQANWYYQFSQQEQYEIRERYILYCEGFGIDFP